MLLVYDAAYSEFIDHEEYTDGSDLVEKNNNVIMLRTFSKLHGLASLRLGWGYCSQYILDNLHTYDAFVYPNIWEETFCISALEALACGLYAKNNKK